MPKRRRFAYGFIDPISIIGGFFLVITLIVGAIVVKNRQISLNINEKAASCMSTCMKEVGDSAECSYVCKADKPAVVVKPPEPVKDTKPPSDKLEKEEIQNLQQVITAPVVINGNIVNPATSQPEVNNPVTQPETITPEQTQPVAGPLKECTGSGGTTYPLNAVVVGGASGQSNGYAKCTSNGWVADCDPSDVIRLCEITDIDPALAAVPVYLQPQYQAAMNALQQNTTNFNQLEIAEVEHIEEVNLAEAVSQAAVAVPSQQITINTNAVNLQQTDNNPNQTANNIIQNAGQDLFNNLLSNIPSWDTYTNPQYYDFNQNTNSNSTNAFTSMRGGSGGTVTSTTQYNRPTTTHVVNTSVQELIDSLTNRFNNVSTNTGMTDVGSYGLGGGNAYVAPVPMNIIKSNNSEEMINYAYGNFMSESAGVLTAAGVLTVLAPAEALSTAMSVMNIKYVPQILTAADALDSTATGVACKLGNPEACSYFAASVAIPGFTSQNMLIDTFDDFATAWRTPLSSLDDLVTFGSSVMRLDGNDIGGWPVNNVAPDIADAISPSGSEMLFATNYQNNVSAPSFITDVSQALDIPNTSTTNMLFAPDPDLVNQRNILNEVTFDQDNWKLATDFQEINPDIRVTYRGQTFEAVSMPEAEEIATRLTGVQTLIPDDSGIIEPALLRSDPRYAGMPSLPAEFGTASVPNPQSQSFILNNPQVQTVTPVTQDSIVVVNYPATVISQNRNIPAASRLNKKNVAEAILRMVGIQPVDPSIVSAANATLDRYTPNIPKLPDLMSFSEPINLNYKPFLSDNNIDSIVKNLLETPGDQLINSIDGITIIPSDSQYKVLVDGTDVEIPHLSIIIDQNGDHFLFVLNDVGNNRVDWTKLPIIENVDNGTYFVEQTVYKLEGPVAQAADIPLSQRFNNWWQNTVGDLNFRGLVDDQVTPPTPLTTRIGDWFDNTIGNKIPLIERVSVWSDNNFDNPSKHYSLPKDDGRPLLGIIVEVDPKSEKITIAKYDIYGNQLMINGEHISSDTKINLEVGDMIITDNTEFRFDGIDSDMLPIFSKKVFDLDLNTSFVAVDLELKTAKEFTSDIISKLETEPDELLLFRGHGSNTLPENMVAGGLRKNYFTLDELNDLPASELTRRIIKIEGDPHGDLKQYLSTLEELEKEFTPKQVKAWALGQSDMNTSPWISTTNDIIGASNFGDGSITILKVPREYIEDIDELANPIYMKEGDPMPEAEFGVVGTIRPEWVVGTISSNDIDTMDAILAHQNPNYPIQPRQPNWFENLRTRISDTISESPLNPFNYVSGGPTDVKTANNILVKPENPAALAEAYKNENFIVLNRKSDNETISYFEDYLDEVARQISIGEYKKASEMLTNEEFQNRIEVYSTTERRLYDQSIIDGFTNKSITPALRNILANPFNGRGPGRVQFGDFVDKPV